MFPQTKPKVLVVDDERDILSSISDLLETEFDVTTTTDPRSGLEDLVHDNISVVISDQRMPIMSGDEFLGLAREKSPATRVLLTGFADIEALGRVVNEGKIYAYLLKPWDPLALRNTVRNAASEYNLLQALHHERDLLRTLVHNIRECVYVQDTSRRYTLVNSAFAKLAGLNDPSEALGKTEIECLPGEFGRIAAEDALHVLRTGDAIVSKLDQCDLPNGIERWYATTRVPVRNPLDRKVEALVGVSIDVTEQKQIQQHLLEAKLIAEQTVMAKEEFLARISHEIRTPLNLILGTTRLLSDTSLVPHQRRYIELLRSNTDTLLRFMNDLIDLSRGDLSELRLTPSEFSPCDFLRTVTESFENEARKRGLRLRSMLGRDIPATAVGDTERLRQLLGNLVGNALKFTEHGEIRIRMRGDPVEADAVVLHFVVEDTGIGIPPEKLDEIFEPFTQAHEFVTSRYGGTGLGLTICRQLVRQMGGSISVARSPEGGSVFRFNVRLQPSKVPVAVRTVYHRNELPKTPLSGLNILLAEDNEENVFLVKAYLGNPGTIEVAGDGREAVDKFVAGKFDIVLMDIRMPEMDGLQATRLIRQWERIHQRIPTPIVAYTAHADSEEASLRAGCNGHLLKGVSAEILLATVAKYANTSQKARPI